MRSSAVTTRVSSSIETVFADEDAFRAWYEAALPRVHRYLYHRCGRDRSLTEELTQETFVEAIRSKRRFAGRDDPLNWVIGIARHRLADHFRRLERHERRVLALATHADDVSTPPADPDDELAFALAALPVMQRAAVVLRYLDDMPVRDVARLLGRSEKAVESLLSRGRDGLRRTYEGTER